MKRTGLLLLLLIVLAGIWADELCLNFFINPQFKVGDIDNLTAQLEKVTNDSCLSINIYAGEIFLPVLSDSLIMNYLEELPGLLFSPNDYLHFYKKLYPNFGLLATNIESDSVMTLKKFVLSNDSLKVGIFTIYTPDLAVKHQFAEGVEFKADVIDLARQQAELLRKTGCDHIIMLTSLSRSVVSYLVDEIDVDSIVSFDYKKTESSQMGRGNKTEYYSLQSQGGSFGRLRIKFDKTKIKTEWQENSWKNAAGNR